MRLVRPPELHPMGCPDCGHPLETTYPADASWRLPLPAGSLTDLGRTVTPLVSVPDDPATLLKLESRNPTGSHEDRFHMICAAIARPRGAPGVFTTSTGNHGVSCAAHAAAEKIPCVVLCDGRLRHRPRAADRRRGRPPRPGRGRGDRAVARAGRIAAGSGDVERSRAWGSVDALRHRRLPPCRRWLVDQLGRPARRRQRALRQRRHPRRHRRGLVDAERRAAPRP